MIKKSIFILFLLFINCHLEYGQSVSDYDKRFIKAKPMLSKQVSSLLQDSTTCETIIYSVFNLDYHIIIKKKQNNYNLFFFKFYATDAQPVLLYYSYIPLSNKDFEDLFNKDLYWKKKNYYNYTPADNYNGSILDGNKSLFFYYAKDSSIIAEFHLPTFTDENPLRINHQFLLDLRMDLIVKYIFAKE